MKSADRKAIVSSIKALKNARIDHDCIWWGPSNNRMRLQKHNLRVQKMSLYNDITCIGEWAFNQVHWDYICSQVTRVMLKS